MGSLPVRGAWIEILKREQRTETAERRSPCGERGLKWAVCALVRMVFPVAPRAGSVD